MSPTPRSEGWVNKSASSEKSSSSPFSILSFSWGSESRPRKVFTPFAFTKPCFYHLFLGCLLYGPPGTGKTLLARAVASQLDANFLKVVSSAIVDKYIGESARLIREMFNYARDHQPCIIFMDEIDAIGGRRFSEGTSADREIQAGFCLWKIVAKKKYRSVLDFNIFYHRGHLWSFLTKWTDLTFSARFVQPQDL